MRIGINALGAITQDTGGRNYLSNFVRAAAELGSRHEFFIFYSGPSEDLWGHLPANFHKIAIPGTNRSSLTKVIGEQFLLPFWTMGRKLDVVYFPGNFTAPLVRATRVVAIRSALYYYFPREIPPIQRAYRKMMSHLTVRNASSIVVPSNSIGGDAIRFMGARAHDIYVVPHGVNTALYSNRPSEADLEQRLEQIGVRRPYFLFVSALWPYKGAHRFLEALDLTRRETGREEITGVVAGKGIASDRYHQELLKFIRTRRLEDAVQLVGDRKHEELAALYWGAEALVFPSYIESFGNPLVEAMASGTPVIASNRHAIPETLGGAGLIVDPDEHFAMARAMQRVMTDRGLRQRMVRDGLERAAAFNWTQAVRYTLALMEESVAGRRPVTLTPFGEAAAATNADGRSINVFILGYFPPPYFGPSVLSRALMRSAFCGRNAVRFLDISLSRALQDVQRIRPSKIFRSARFLFQTWREFRSRKYDVVLCPISLNRISFLKDAALAEIAEMEGIPVVWFAQGYGLREFYRQSPGWLQRWMRQVIGRSAGAVVLADALRDDFEGLLPPELVMAVEPGTIPLELPVSPIRRKDVVTVAYVGALAKTKGIFLLIQAMAKIVPEFPSLRLVCAGDWFRKEEQREWEQFLAEHNLQNHVQCIGPVYRAAKAKLYAESDLLVFPTFPHEAFGLVLLEAMNSSLPIVTTRRAAIRDLITDGEGGVLIPPHDADALAAGMLRLARDPELRKSMGEINRARYFAHYTNQHYGERMIVAMDELLRCNRERGRAGSRL